MESAGYVFIGMAGELWPEDHEMASSKEVCFYSRAHPNTVPSVMRKRLGSTTPHPRSLPMNPPILNRRKRRERRADEEMRIASRVGDWRSNRVIRGLTRESVRGNLSPLRERQAFRPASQRNLHPCNLTALPSVKTRRYYRQVPVD